MTLTELADATFWLPDGCALWLSMGGPRSLSQEAHLLRLVEYRVRSLDWRKTKDAQNNRNVPEPIPVPPYAHEETAERVREETRAQAWRRRQQKKSQ